MKVLKTTLLIAILMSVTSMGFADNLTVNQCMENWLYQKFPVKEGIWKVAILSSDKPMNWSEVSSCSVTGVVGTKKPKKIMVFNIVSKVGDIVYKRQVTARVLKYLKIPIANNVIRRGVTLDENQWRIEERSEEMLTKDTITDYQLLGHLRSKKVISSNEVFTWHSVEKIPDIVQGKEMTLRVVASGVILSTDAVSLEEGNIEDWISLKQQHNGQVVKAKIVSSSEAMILLAQRK